MATVRMPASDFGGPRTRVPSLSSWYCSTTLIRPWTRSMRSRVEGEHLAEPQPGERGDEHHGPKPRSDGVGDLEHLRDRGDRPLGRPLLARALDRARVPRDELVGHRGVEDGVQQPVALRHGRRAGRAGLEHRRVPVPHPGRRDPGQLEVAEHRKDVEAQLALVQLDRARSEIGPLLQPPGGVRPQRHLAGAGIDPRAALHVRPDRRQVRLGVSLGTKRRRRRDHLAVDAVPRLVPPRRQLPDTSP